MRPPPPPASPCQAVVQIYKLTKRGVTPGRREEGFVRRTPLAERGPDLHPVSSRPWVPPGNCGTEAGGAEGAGPGGPGLCTGSPSCPWESSCNSAGSMDRSFPCLPGGAWARTVIDRGVVQLPGKTRGGGASGISRGLSPHFMAALRALNSKEELTRGWTQRGEATPRVACTHREHSPPPCEDARP